jgi:signal transduction histidine kinase
MYERLAAFRGQLTLLSRPGAGTELRVWIPLLQESNVVGQPQIERT